MNVGGKSKVKYNSQPFYSFCFSLSFSISLSLFLCFSIYLSLSLSIFRPSLFTGFPLYSKSISARRPRDTRIRFDERGSAYRIAECFFRACRINGRLPCQGLFRPVIPNNGRAKLPFRMHSSSLLSAIRARLISSRSPMPS